MRFRSSIVFILLCTLAGSEAFAAGGHLKGKITDLTTGESLPLANILIVGSGRGGVTDDQGEYFVKDVSPGTYDLRVSLLGYQTIQSKSVEIIVGETAVLNFKLASTDIEMEGVTVVGKAPLVDVTKSAGDQTFTRDKIEQIPNVKTVEDVLGLQAGITKFGGQLFLRGGRANETQILIDGVPVNDVSGNIGAAGTSSANEQLAELYSGNSTSGVGGALGVAANAISSVTVSSSGLDPEFGNAQSGVVSIQTKSGGDRYSGSVNYRTDAITSQTFDERYYAADIGGPEPITSYLLPSLGLDIPGNISFFINGTFDQSDGPYGFNTSQFYNPIQRKVTLFGSDAGFTYSDKQFNNFTFNSKVTYQPGDNNTFSVSYRSNARTQRPLYARYGWRDYSDSLSTDLSEIDQAVIAWTHVLGPNSSIRSHLSRLQTERNTSVGGLNPSQYSPSNTSSANDLNNDGFIDLGSGQSWSTALTQEYNFKVHFESQIHPLHMLRTGIDYYYQHFQSTAISFPNAPFFQRDTSSRGAFPGYGQARWVSNNIPSRGAIYIQDRIDLTGIGIHVGLRYDFFYLGNQVFDQEFIDRWTTVTGEQPGWLDNRTFMSQLVRGNVSPRLAINYPISSRAHFYFNYGHFLQYPDLDQYFHDPTQTTLTGNYVGNPALKPQRTVQYEAAYEQLIFEDLRFDIRGFYKDIFDYASFRRLGVSPAVDMYVNLDYASSRGFELILNKALSNRYTGSISYTFQVAKGRSSDPFAAQASPQLFGLPREVRLDWDQTHSVNLFLGYRVGPREDFSVFGLPFNNWGVSATWIYGSGFPYTPYNEGRDIDDLYLKNTGSGPHTSEVNISLDKGFTIMDHLNLVVTFAVQNLLNRRNVDLNAGGFNNVTGGVRVYGDFNPIDPRDFYQWGPDGRRFDSSVPPFALGNPRQITLGVKLNWN
ncbi:MAG: TonB-dependent receptor [Ignavibacteria bacterium]|nr:TonB-dependent receptor [Ignavibacteria bacterium]